MSRGRERDERGRFVETIALEDVIAAIQRSDTPVVTAKEVGESLGCTSEAARRKLIALLDEGVVERRKVGAGAVIWWLVEDDPALDDADEIDPEDPFWNAEPFSGGELVEEDDLDDVLYGELMDES
jgi:hypothetical protein